MISLGHDPLSFVEFDSGLARLATAGLIVFEGNRVTPMDEALMLAEEVMCQNGSAQRFHAQLLDVLTTISIEDRGVDGYTTEVLLPTEYDQAFI
ncbi:hypothetical protein [Planctomycetes bacterium CA13]|uniref:hypothetical protein n=1 Tax=Novipirellula herctigrandis TaxID=2527986 RepID=UPI0011B3A5A2